MKPRLTLIGGGARSGKSSFAQGLGLRRGDRRTYVATAQALDAEMADRIARHVDDRGTDFETLEVPEELEVALTELEHSDVVVVDCLTLWLSNLCCADYELEEIERRIQRLTQVLAARTRETIVVTNEVGLGIVPLSSLGRLFRDVAGRMHRELAAEADEVYLGAMGAMVRLKPAPVVALFGDETERVT